jgi:large subunit ribosomal protein L37Ae
MAKKKETLKGLGAKYGSTLRKRYTRIYVTLKSRRECPSCSSQKFKRIASGIWKCGKCGYTVAGGAYEVSQEARK